MNIYEKLQHVRVDLAAEGLKKGKVNTYGKYEYFELADFLPQVNNLCLKHKLSHSTTVSDDEKQVILTMRDIEKPEATIEFKIPLSHANLKAAHEIQNLGAVLTYSRRYLYMLAFDIVQGDALEATTGKNDNAATFVWKKGEKPADELKRLWRFVGWKVDDLPDYVNNRAKNLNSEVNDALYETILTENISYLQEEAKKGNAAYKNFSFTEDEQIPF